MLDKIDDLRNSLLACSLTIHNYSSPIKMYSHYPALKFTFTAKCKNIKPLTLGAETFREQEYNVSKT